MDMTTQSPEIFDATFEEEHVDPIGMVKRKEPRRQYGIETIYDNLDPRAALYEGITTQISASTKYPL